MRHLLAPTSSSSMRLALVVLLVASCGTDRSSPAGEPPPGSARPGSQPGVDPISPISSRDSSPSPGAPGPGAEVPSGDPIQWALPAGWRATPPTNPMRMAQAEIPGPAGAAEMAVFHFGPGGGGGIEANLDRWVAQMEGGGEPERGDFESGPFRVTWITVPGTYDPGMMGMAPSEPQPGWRLLGAVVEGEGGPWFFKITGPDETVAAAREDFFALLRSVRATG